MAQYGKNDYWDERYTKDPEPFDWYQRYIGVSTVIEEFVLPESKILNIGAGNSRLSEEMFDEGYQQITNIDISGVVVKQMQDKYKDKGPDFKYLQMDVRTMDFEDGQFDVVIDKATFDSLLCGEGSTANAQKTLKEIYRVLNQDGMFICISYGLPEHRLMFFEKPEFQWTIQHVTVNKPTISTQVPQNSEDKDSPNSHFIYICKKGKPIQKIQ